jgi:hypothetical protein
MFFMSVDKPKLRVAPSAAELAAKQAAALQLLQLDAWTEEPSNPPSTGLTATITPTLQNTAEALEIPAPPKTSTRPWMTLDAAKPHPYHVVCSEALFQKMDFVWKRNGNKSLREWVLNVLETEANNMLKELGE